MTVGDGVAADEAADGAGPDLEMSGDLGVARGGMGGDIGFDKRGIGFGGEAALPCLSGIGRMKPFVNGGRIEVMRARRFGNGARSVLDGIDDDGADLRRNGNGARHGVPTILGGLAREQGGQVQTGCV